MTATGREGNGQMTDRTSTHGPLSPVQEQMWFLNQLEPERPEHTTVFAWRLRGPLRPVALTQALEWLAQRHDALRTTFATVEGRPRQTVGPPAPVEPEYADLAELPAAERRPRAEALLRRMARRPVDLAAGPVLRVLLARLDATEHLLTMLTPALVADRACHGVLTRELGELYAAALEQRPARLPDVPLRPLEYAARQRERLTDAELARQLEHWLGRLADLPDLRLPADRPRIAQPPGPTARHETVLPAEVVHGLTGLVHEFGGTLFTGLFAACQVLFARYSGQQDLAVGSVAEGRERPGLRSAVGSFANPVVLRGTVRPHASFAQQLAESRGTVQEAFAHQDVPFGRLVDALDRRGQDGRNPMVRTAVVLRQDAAHPARAGALSLHPCPPPGVPLGAELAVEFTETAPGEVTCSLAYDATLFERGTVERLARNLVVLLRGAVADPGRPVAELPVLDEMERRTLLEEWGVNRSPYPDRRCLHELVGEHARARPEAVAVVHGDAAMTYGELDARAIQLADLLTGQGVAPGTFVAVCLPRGPELFAALLGVLRAGCAYLLLEPGHPADRLEFMIRDTGAALCLTERPLLHKLPADAVRTVCLDEQRAAVTARPTEPPAVEVTSDAGAYVIYTSGSTGRPKGTVVTHRAFVRLLRGADYLTLGPDDVSGQGADVTFDAAAFEIWAPLTAGARLVVIDKQTLLDPPALTGLLKARGFTTLFLTTALFNQVVAEDPSAFGGLRNMLFGGEAVNSLRVSQVLAADPPRRLVHLYGPSETTTFATWHLVREADEHRPVPIGRPVANTTVYVLDELLNPVPVGVTGELFVAGPGVARGYIDRPELTAERFLDNPYGTLPADRMYRTGDLVRWSAEGALEYVGRADHQVKIRGYRIEPSEIERVLQQHPDIDAALVVARAAEGDHKRLVAYVRPVAGCEPDPGALRDFAAVRLPDFMVPAALVTLTEFPLTSSGKVDRAALPEPELTGRPAGPGRVEPRTDAERALAAIWAEVLGVERVGVTDNFYELGGDSILGVKVVARARKAGLAISAKDVFRRQTVAELAGVAVLSDT
ncbi:amino acid adenylation domain-containing protein [Streptomyces sp. 110]|uniref:Amino acid adenylation domain-containing protein n=1 Tax=Streptomyces endocoffeicus TaxID=2898945 RepID=A0ABS1Q8G2_9ACTN|nr:non-ribosomal peptide synthetase [Streptomyces endocoffeicus]MBL1120221.1 amino acid adenylation domain-containing protein [Streptomyces endocoffeicus]